MMNGRSDNMEKMGMEEDCEGTGMTAMLEYARGKYIQAINAIPEEELE